MDPRNPDIMYAVKHQRIRNVAALMNGGPESGIFKSVDGGNNWRELTNGLPEEDMGKIGLAVSPIDPDVVYATIELGGRKGGFWRSLDGGESWEKRSDYLSGGTGPHYYQEIFASPHKLDRVYQMDATLHITEDGGKTWPIARDVVEGFFGYSALIQLDAETIGLFYEANHYKDVRFVTLPVKRFAPETNPSGRDQ